MRFHRISLTFIALLVTIGLVTLAAGMNPTFAAWLGPIMQAAQRAQPITTSMITGLTLILLSLVFYFLPTLVGRKRRNGLAIFILNLFLGWTLVGWVVALAWAAMPDPPSMTST